MTVVAVVGLGYVGLPLAVEFGKKYRTIGFDLSVEKISAYCKHVDPTGEVSQENLKQATLLEPTTDASKLKEADFVIVAVPTPVDDAHNPDFSPLVGASTAVGKYLKPGAIVVYESTVYPGATEEICVPILEKQSGLKWKKDFFVGYSPERINPGDKEHTLTRIVKVVSGDTPETLETVGNVYASVITAGVHRAESIKVAEAAKVIENTQRDLNIALMNELSLIFHRIGIDTLEVLKAAGTKWNFLPFRPGLVGGHCIGVDPYYLIHKAQEAGYYPELVVAARRINDGMAAHVVARLLRRMALAQINVVGARILVMGATFKEDCPDLRNSQVAGVVAELRACHAQVEMFDPWADATQCEHEFGLAPVAQPHSGAYDAVLIAVAHRQFREMGEAGIRALLRPGGIVFDVKYLLPREASDERL